MKNLAPLAMKHCQPPGGGGAFLPETSGGTAFLARRFIREHMKAAGPPNRKIQAGSAVDGGKRKQSAAEDNDRILSAH